MEVSGERGRLMYWGIGLVFAILLALYFVYQIRVVALVFLLTLLFSIILSAPVDFLERRGLGRGWGTLAVFGGLTLVLGLSGVLLAPTIEGQARSFAEAFPALLANVQDRIGQLRAALGLELSFSPDPRRLLGSAGSFLSGGGLSTAADLGASVVSLLSFGAVILVATVFTVARPAPLVNGFVALFPAGRRSRVREILGLMYKAVQRWFLGQLVSMSIIGLLFTVSMLLIGIPFALLLGVLSGFLAFIPFIGAILSVIPPILLALVDDPIKALWIFVAYLFIQAIEGNVVQPVVMNRAVELHPTVLVFSLLIASTLFGFVGLLLAIPLVAALHVLVRELWTRRMESLGTDPDPPPEDEGKKAEPAKRKVGRLRRALAALLRRP